MYLWNEDKWFIYANTCKYMYIWKLETRSVIYMHKRVQMHVHGRVCVRVHVYVCLCRKHDIYSTQYLISLRHESHYEELILNQGRVMDTRGDTQNKSLVKWQ